MRTIKFRGFHACDYGDTTICVNGEAVRGKWVTGSLYQYKGTAFIIQEDSTSEEGSGYAFMGGDPIKIFGAHKVDLATVGQFTGLTDKDGREICEGSKVNDIGEGTGKVVFWNGAFIIALDEPWDPMMTWYYLDNRNAVEIEAVGTVFDAPKEG